GGVAAGQPLLHHADHDLVRDQLAGVEELAGLLPELGPRPHRRPERVARRDVRNDVVARQAHRLGSLPGSLLAEDNETCPRVHREAGPKTPRARPTPDRVARIRGGTGRPLSAPVHSAWTLGPLRRAPSTTSGSPHSCGASAGCRPASWFPGPRRRR